jgi:hypothetical protein
MTDEVDAKAEVHAWDPLPGESPTWYSRFFQFYLLVTSGRSVRGAWVLYRVEKGGDPSIAKALTPQKVPREWLAVAREFDWIGRAAAYDADQRRQALETVDSVRLKLQQATPQALQALLDALTNPRTMVKAATAIFNRAGLPAVSKQEVQANVGVSLPTAAEAAQALDELEKEEHGNKPA